MTNDPIIKEIHKFREAHARKFHYDIDAIFADIRKRQATRANLSPLKPVKPVLPPRGRARSRVSRQPGEEAMNRRLP